MHGILNVKGNNNYYHFLIQYITPIIIICQGGNVVNEKIRAYAQKQKVKLWEIAERLGMQDSNFSKKLRRELNDDETERIIKAIDELVNEKGGGDNA